MGKLELPLWALLVMWALNLIFVVILIRQNKD